MARRLKANDPTKATSPKASPVEVRNIAHPGVWALALSLAGGEASRIEVESYSRVWVTVPSVPMAAVEAVVSEVA